jgi:hypothetical protein
LTATIQAGPAITLGMTRILAFLAASVLAFPASAQDASAQPVSLEQAMLLRCSAAFAIVADEQQRGVASARVYPPMAARGREYFVRSGARLMDELQLTREQLQARLQSEAEGLRHGAAEAGDSAAYLDTVMQPCLAALDASGL